VCVDGRRGNGGKQAHIQREEDGLTIHCSVFIMVSTHIFFTRYMRFKKKKKERREPGLLEAVAAAALVEDDEEEATAGRAGGAEGAAPWT
jgi:hypothetical protein